MTIRRQPVHALLVALLLAGCNGSSRITPTVKPPIGVGASSSPTQLAQAVLLTGKVKLLSDSGGSLVANNAGNLVSDNGGGVISNNTGGLLSDSGGGLISDGGSSLRLLATDAPAVREFALADAQVTFKDAAGKPVLGKDGKPLTATTDATGTYKLTAPLPAGNLVMEVALGAKGLLHGGKLSALLPHSDAAGRTQAIDTASSLGAAYVLSKFVQGDQKTLDKLPAGEAELLQTALAAAAKLLSRAPGYDQDALVATTDALRAQAPDVNKTLTDIQALLLGQSNLGNGRQALSVALSDVAGLGLTSDGTMLVGERFFGRIRSIAPNGTISTRVDVLRGQVKTNFPGLDDLIAAPDGTLYVAAANRVIRVSPDGTTTVIAGNGTGALGAVGVPTSTAIAACSLALAPDGTLYIGEDQGFDDSLASPRVLALSPDRTTLTALALAPEWAKGHGVIAALSVSPAGTLFILYTNYGGGEPGSLSTYTPGQGFKRLTDGFSLDAQGGGLAAAPDGSVYVSEAQNARVTHVLADGTHQVVAGRDGPAATQDLGHPHAMVLRQDGTLLIADSGSQVVRALGLDGSWQVLAGTLDPNLTSGDLRAISLDGPVGVVFDAQGRMVVAEDGSARVRRLDGTSLTTLAGSVKGNNGAAGDGGKATDARFNGLTGVVYWGDRLLVSDPQHATLHAVAADGTITALVGNDQLAGAKDAGSDLDPSKRVPAGQFPYNGSNPIVGPDNLVYWINGQRQIMRLRDGSVEVVAGQVGSNTKVGSLDVSGLAGFLSQDGQPAVQTPLLRLKSLAFGPNGDLYFTDELGLQVRKVVGATGPNPTIASVAGQPSSIGAAAVLADPSLANDTADAKSGVLMLPYGLCVDPQGTVYVAEIGTATLPLMVTLTGDDLDVAKDLPQIYARVRKITPDGRVTTIVGPGGRFLTDPTADDGLVLPTSLSLAPDGRLAIVDTGANHIVVLPAGTY